MKEKTNIIILFGGVSSEHEVSRKSAASVLKHINAEKYDINTIGITKNGNWFLTYASGEDIEKGVWESDSRNRRVFISPERENGGIFAETEGAPEHIPADVIVPVLHGRNGEDGTMQGLLHIVGIPYVGSDTTASAASMDKAVTKAMVEKAGGVNQAESFLITEKEYKADKKGSVERMTSYFGSRYPLFVKPANAGSSVGISKVKAEAEIDRALEIAFAEDPKVVVEIGIVGREIEVAVLGNEDPKASCVGEIFAANEFYDYDAKYENQASKTGIVTDLPDEKIEEIKAAAVRVYEIMGCRGLSRVDFFLEDDGRIVFNEINTLPGFTNISMYPQLWEASGIEYSDLIDRIIELALQ